MNASRHTPIPNAMNARSFPVLSETEEKKLVRRWKKTGDRDALDRLIESHLRLVPRIARKYSGYGINVDDLISEGHIGLMQSVERFKPEKGFRFSTYARWWIRAAILNFILQTWSLIKVGNSASKKKLFFNLKRAKREMTLEGSRYLSDADVELIARRFQVSTRDVIAMDQRLSAIDPSLDQPVSDEDGNTLTMLDTIADDTDSPEESYASRERERVYQDAINRSLTNLDARERDIVTKRYLTDRPKTLSALATVYGVTAERIRQIESGAISKLKSALAPEASVMALDSI
ncbi:MAG: RNA polymerase factor sigma-32 [Rhodospirillaceae bacterium]|nr:RNA polymerase factor sigma-32 [Rhodospirillaceae bacterium]